MPLDELRQRLILYLEEEDGLNLLSQWLSDQSLPPLGHDVEPHRWLFLALPVGSERWPVVKELAARLGRLLDTFEPERNRDSRSERCIRNALLLAGNLSCAEKLGDSLEAIYDRFKSKPSLLPDRTKSALREAIERNQVSKKFKRAWIQMISGKPSRLLGGNEYQGWRGLVRIPAKDNERAPFDEIRTGLTRMIDVLGGRRNRSRKFTKLLSDLRQFYPDLNWGARLISFAEENAWPTWAIECLPRLVEDADGTTVMWSGYNEARPAGGRASIVEGRLCGGFFVRLSDEWARSEKTISSLRKLEEERKRYPVSRNAPLIAAARDLVADLNFEPTLEQSLTHWSRAGLPPTSHVFEFQRLILDEISDKRTGNAHKFSKVRRKIERIAPITADLLTFVIDSYVRGGGYFSFSPGAGDGEASFNTRSALAVLKAAEGVACEAPLVGGGRFKRPEVRKFLIGSVRKEIIDRANFELQSCLQETALQQPATLIDLYWNLWILYNTGERAFVDDFCTRSLIEDFLRSCYQARRGKRAASFTVRRCSESMDEERRCVTAVYFVERIARYSQLEVRLKSLLQSTKKFVIECWDSSGDGGFATRPGRRGTLLHTHFAMYLSRFLRWDLMNVVDRRYGFGESGLILKFVEACRCSGGFSFVPGTNANTLATYMGPRVLKSINCKPSVEKEIEYLEALVGFRNGPAYSGYMN